MRYKTLMALAVAAAVGWSASAVSGPGHEVITPTSANETGPVIVSHESGHSGWRAQHEATIVSSSASYSPTDNGGYLIDNEAVGATADSGSGSTGVTSDEYASLSDEDVLALADQGIYTDFYRVSFTPIALSGWNYYVLDDGFASYALVEPVIDDNVTLAWSDSYGGGDGAVTQVFEDGSILQVFDDGSMLAFDEGYGIPAGSVSTVIVG
jgi:hypothetical protein